MDASYRSSEVLIWNCHNQHGNQVKISIHYLKPTFDPSRKLISRSIYMLNSILALEISIRSNVSSDIEKVRICFDTLHQPIKINNGSVPHQNDSL